MKTTIRTINLLTDDTILKLNHNFHETKKADNILDHM